MKTAEKLIAALVVSTTSFCVVANEPVADPHGALVQKTIASFMANNKVPGVAVELYVDGKPYDYYYGYADLAKKQPVTNKTIFELGSISKVMTSILFAQEVDWAKMSFTDPMTKYIKDLPEALNGIKLQDLATHTSGLPFDYPKTVINQNDLSKYLAHGTPDVDPGQEWAYSNLGIDVLSLALEKSSEMDYTKLYRRHILNPLKMVVGVTVTPNLMQSYAQGYDEANKPVAHVAADSLPAAGGIKATGEDMQHFLSAAIGLPGTPPRLFYPIRMTQSSFVKMPDFMQGLGWKIYPFDDFSTSGLLHVSDENDLGPIQVKEIFARPMYTGNALIDKTGTTDGFKAYIAVIPSKNSGIVLLANKNVPTSEIVVTARKLLFKLSKV